MQIRALDSQAQLIFADQANKHKDYLCVECQQTVRLRRGIHRKAHYYHIQPNRICRLHTKGMPHLMLQQHLKNMLPEGEVELECQFASIGRIADVAWHPKRLVYEIQCSPISAEEVRARNKSYASIGYQVVWIFHDDRYNKHRLSAAEISLRDQPHYFSDMDGEGVGRIYDQFSVIANARRVQRLPAFSVDVSRPKFLKENIPIVTRQFPKVLHQRLKSWPVMFDGDTLDYCLTFNKGDDRYRELILQLKKLEPHHGRLWLQLLGYRKDFFRRCLVVPYFSLMKLILERACR